MTEPKQEAADISATEADTTPHDWKAPEFGWGGVEHEVIHRAKDYSSFKFDFNGNTIPGYRYSPVFGWVKDEEKP